MTFPFTAVVGADDMALALVLTAISPEIGGVLVRGEKGTAKSTLVRALAEVLPYQDVVDGCRYACDPARPDPQCPDGPHPTASSGPASSEHTTGKQTQQRRPALVELPVGAAEDRVVGSLDLGRALGSGETAFEPGLLAQANRGLLYVDEVNLLGDHLIDVLLDAAAMGRNTVERDGVSVSHAARITLVGTMNPEEGELRPQLLDRFGLTVEVAASREPGERAEVVRRRLAHDADPAGFAERFADAQGELTAHLTAAQGRLPAVVLSDRALATIARVCAGFDVDGMRADIVTARAAIAHAAWFDRAEVTRADIRAAALFALPHRRRRAPFDAPGLDEELLDRLLDEEPEPPTPEDEGGDPAPQDGPDEPSDGTPTEDGQDSQDGPTDGPSSGPSDGPAADPAPDPPQPPASDRGETTGQDAEPAPDQRPDATVAPIGVAAAGETYATRLLTARTTGDGVAGRRSRALTSTGRVIGARRGSSGPVHLAATVRAAAPHQASRRRDGERRLVVTPGDVHRRRHSGREANLVLLAVDASGSMAARRRMREVKSAVLSLLLDAYQRRDQVGLVTFRGAGAELVLPPTTSIDIAATRLADLGHGGRTPLAEGLTTAARTLELARIRDPHRRPLLVLVTDGRATSGPDALARARAVADAWPATGWEAIVLDSESGRVRLGLAADLARRMGAQHLPISELAAGDVLDAVHTARPLDVTAPLRPLGRAS